MNATAAWLIVIAGTFNTATEKIDACAKNRPVLTP